MLLRARAGVQDTNTAYNSELLVQKGRRFSVHHCSRDLIVVGLRLRHPDVFSLKGGLSIWLRSVSRRSHPVRAAQRSPPRAICPVREAMRIGNPPCLQSQLQITPLVLLSCIAAPEKL